MDPGALGLDKVRASLAFALAAFLKRADQACLFRVIHPQRRIFMHF